MMQFRQDRVRKNKFELKHGYKTFRVRFSEFVLCMFFDMFGGAPGPMAAFDFMIEQVCNIDTNCQSCNLHVRGYQCVDHRAGSRVHSLPSVCCFFLITFEGLLKLPDIRSVKCMARTEANHQAYWCGSAP